MGPYTPYVLAATSVVLPMLLDEGERAGLPIPAFITDAQRAAMAVLSQPVLGVVQADATDLRALDRVSNVCVAMIPLRGAIDGRTDLAKLTADDVDQLLTSCLDAARAGVDAGGYDVVPSVIAPVTQGNLFDAIVSNSVSSSAALTSLGAAVYEAARKRDFARATSGVADLVQIPGQLAAKDLALEMDSAGYLVSGQPIEPSIIGGLGAAASAVGNFVGSVAGGVAGGVAEAAASALLSTPGLIILAGLVVWKVVKS